MKKLMALILVLVVALSITVYAVDDPGVDAVKNDILIVVDDPGVDCWNPPVEIV
jgi:putative cell wall-binding protein